jgi:translation initiation factor IF-2
MMSQLKSSAGLKEFPLVIKGDVQGSVEAIVGCAREARHRRGPRAHRSPVPARITESDVTLAETSGRGAMIGFNVRANKRRRVRPPNRPASRSATTTSSTIWWMT